MIDFLVLLVLGVAGFVGARRGWRVMALTCLGLIAGYLVAMFLYRPMGRSVARLFSISPLIAMPVVGMLVLAIASRTPRYFARKFARERHAKIAAGEKPLVADLAGGAVLAVMYASVFVVVVAWAAQAAHGFLKMGPDLSDSFTWRIANRVMRGATFSIARQRTGSTFVASLLSNIATDPQKGVAAINGLVQDTVMQQLWSDETVRSALADGNVDALAASAPILALANNAALGDAARQLGLIGPDSGGAKAVAGALVQRVTPVMQGLEAANRDGDVQRQLADPRMQELLHSGDVRAMMADSSFTSLAGRVLKHVRTPK